jgi:putative PIN family toxin of toxin-antitoxin system
MKIIPKVVLDTNILLVSISSRSEFHWIFQKILNDEIEVFVTNDILLEYEEIISQKYNSKVAKSVIKTFLLLPNVHQATVYYNWHLIKDDADDNKFADCAINSNVNFLVTNDSHFAILKKIDFPKIEILNIVEFENLFCDK